MSGPGADKEFRCPVCAATGRHRFLHRFMSKEFGSPFEIYECERCETKRCEPFLTNEQLESYYRDESVVGADKYEKWRGKYRYAHDWVGARIPVRGTRVVEIGCNSGNLLRYFKETSGCDVTGIEFSGKCKEYSERVNGVPIFQGDARTYAKGREGAADLVIMVHVLEHVTDPDGLLDDVATLLRDGGHAFIEIPNSRMAEFSLTGEFANPLCMPFHSFIYCMEGLDKLLGRHGLEVRHRRYWSRGEDTGSISQACAAWVRHHAERLLGQGLAARIVSGLGKAVVRFYPNRIALAYCMKSFDRASSIGVLAQRVARSR